MVVIVQVFCRFLRPGSGPLRPARCEVRGSGRGNDHPTLNEGLFSLFAGGLYIYPSTRYLIVFDDIWDQRCWEEVRNYCPDNSNGSRIIITTRLEQVAEYARLGEWHFKKRFLNQQESWLLFCDKVFGGDHSSCPPELEKAGRKIVKKCEGLPLTIIAVARHLHDAERTPEYWKQATKKVHTAIIGADKEASEGLGPKPPAPFFPVFLRKLTLGGLGLPWEEMNLIACLPNLEVLKLRCYAFRGPEWETFEGGFLKLRVLLIEDTDLEYWRVGCFDFPCLQRLLIHHCYKLKEIPRSIGEHVCLEMIEIVDGTPSLVASAKQIQHAWGFAGLEVCVKSSLEENGKGK
ncbi:putative late blight resistance protein homolog R1B-13 [Sesamum indicum]|uniref:Late blight resistance protein homolog R1B-13 n=1 Tax=Sesamum indicum TaxID=4182 RepID=A0A6I9V2Y8_SESIN|nr:putative late blight resistance protein homolog R1B-13 [Sesamum indicum]